MIKRNVIISIAGYEREKGNHKNPLFLQKVDCLIDSNKNPIQIIFDFL